MQYQVNLSQAENDALGYVAVSQQEWIDNAIHERCRVAIDEIVQIAVTKCLDAGIQIPNNKDAIVELAFAQGWVTSAVDQLAQNSTQLQQGA